MKHLDTDWCNKIFRHDLHKMSYTFLAFEVFSSSLRSGFLEDLQNLMISKWRYVCLTGSTVHPH